MTILDSIDKKLEKWKSEKAYGYFVVQYDYEPKLYIGRESWRILKMEMCDQLSYYPYPQEHDTVMGMKIVVVDKKFYLEVE